jgi:hypothetical protein
MENMQMPNSPNQSAAPVFDSHLTEDSRCRLERIAGVLDTYKLLFSRRRAVVGINIAN